MYGCERWTIKKAGCRRVDAFGLWCWRRLLRVPWTARRSNQSILKEIDPDYSLEGLKLKLQYFGHLVWRADSLEKTLILGKIEGERRRGQQRMRWLHGITGSMDMSWSKLIPEPIPDFVCSSLLSVWASHLVLVVENPPANAGDTEDAGDMGLIPGSERSTRVGKSTPLQHSCLENYVGRGAWQTTVHGPAKSRTWLSDWSDLIHLLQKKKDLNPVI